MNHEKYDILIHYDEAARKLIFYQVSTAELAEIRARSFDGVQMSIADLKAMPAEEAEMRLGSGLFAALDTSSLERIGIRDYEQLTGEAMARYAVELVAEAEAGDPSAQYHLFIHLHHQSLKSASLEDLDEAERLLQAAAAQGHEPALSSLEHWPMLKAALRRIKR